MLTIRQLNACLFFAAARQLGLLAGFWLSVSVTALAQDMERVRQNIRSLTAPAMHGRGYVRQGNQKAANYLRQRFRQLHLQPLAPDFTQHFPLDVNTFPGDLRLQAGGQNLRPGLDFIAEPTSGGGRISGSVLVLDTLIFTNETVGQHWLNQNLGGKIVVLRQRDADRLRTLPDAFTQHLDQAAARLTLVTKLTASLAATQDPQPRLLVLTDRWPPHVAQAIIQVEARLQRDYRSQNIIGYVPGRIHPDSFLLVTAHYDHLGHMGKQAYFPGANDNASGTVMLLELATYYAQSANRPAYSVVFIAFGAEEAGLVGSRYFVDHPLMPLTQIRFLVNLDLLGTGDEGLTVVNGRLLPGAYQLLTRLNDTYHFVSDIAARGRAANSDHFLFSERGVPAFFLYTRGGSKAYHDVRDRAETLPLTAFTGVFGLIRQFLTAMGATPP
ncbi:peptidase M28 [Hymenobacter roseosalivarius DSM 11622]|uniref:Peptidase M28 n=1 Tax=Hymenobacter roseosalivarius DSM 11622 TaxID=645990 RepID=A0A1W1VQQ7_9BACT|nr:M28 family peptidase [Hymenobacter roseosalivarius]SMB95705.1 peptidase M28 [Hymenobacter roseosalivarius DSM 11622]